MPHKFKRQTKWFGYRPWVIILIAAFLILSVVFIPFFVAEKVDIVTDKVTITATREASQTETTGERTRVYMGQMREESPILYSGSSPFVFTMAGLLDIRGIISTQGACPLPGKSGIEYTVNPGDAIVRYYANKEQDDTSTVTLVNNKEQQFQYRGIVYHNLAQTGETTTIKTGLKTRTLTEQIPKTITRERITRIRINLLELLSGQYRLLPFASLEIDPAELSPKVADDAARFDDVLEEINSTEISMSEYYPGAISIPALFPNSWLTEFTKPGEGQMKIALGIPIASNTAVYLKPTLISSNLTVYYERGGKCTPETDTYIVVYDGPAPGLASFCTGPTNFKDYPRRVDTDSFKSYKIVDSPYFIPPYTTNGIYSLVWDEFRKQRADYAINQLLADLADANPYKDRTNREAYKAERLKGVLQQFYARLAAVDKDLSNALAFADDLEIRFFKPNSDRWTTQGALSKYKKDIETMRGKLLQIRSNLQKLETWDFYNLEQYLNSRAKGK